MILWLLAVPFGVVVALVLVLVWQARRTVALSDPTGPHPVGRLSYDWLDSSRAETFSKVPGARREMVAWFWYPASPSQNEKPAPYLPERWAKVLGELGSNARFRPWTTVRIHAMADAPVAPNHHPILIFSPGYTAVPTDYTFLAEDLASQGFIVLGVTATYSARVVAFADGRTVKPIPETAFPPSQREDRDRLVGIWAADLLYAINQLEALNADRRAPFFERLDLGRLGVFGHSFGGAAALETCRLDGRCKAAIDIDGEPLGTAAKTGTSRPTMLLLAEPAPTSRFVLWFEGRSREEDQRKLEGAYRDLDWLYRNTADAYRVTIRGARHVNFADPALLSPTVGRLFGSLGAIDGRRGLQITAAYIAAFFGKFVNGVESPLLAGSSREYPEVVFESGE